MDTQVKPGWKTSEFWLTLLAQVPTALGLFLGASNPITLGVGGACLIAYTICRSQVKSQAAVAAIQAAAQAVVKP